MQTNSIPYTFVRSGYFYFSRRVPADLQDYYSYPRVVQGLRTSSPQKAKVLSNVAAAKLDAYWSQMRLAKSEVIGMSLVKEMPLSNSLSRVPLVESFASGQVDCLSLLYALPCGQCVTNINAAFMQYTFNLAETQRVTHVIHNC